MGENGMFNHLEIGIIITLISAVLLYHKPKPDHQYSYLWEVPQFGIYIGIYFLILGIV